MLEKKPLIQVVDRAFDILELLADTQDGLSSGEIALRVGVSLQSANNLVRTLYRRGYLAQVAGRRYRLGSQCFYLGSFADRWGGMRDAAAEPLRELVEKSHLTGFVGVIENDRLLCVAMLNPGETSVRQPPQLWADELHCTASGRVLLAALSGRERKRFLARVSRRQKTEATVVEAAALESSCEAVRQAGFAELVHESRPDTSSLAVPLHDVSGHVVAALGLAGADPSWRVAALETKLAWMSTAVARLERR
jgi:IclR family acetate operon transcriptional repressor